MGWGCEACPRMYHQEVLRWTLVLKPLSQKLLRFHLSPCPNSLGLQLWFKGLVHVFLEAEGINILHIKCFYVDNRSA